MKCRCLFFLLMLLHVSSKAQESDSFSFFFPMDQPQLTNETTQKIDSLFYADWLNTSVHLDIIGYADYVGGKGIYNQKLSAKRAENVADYLIENGIKAENIRLIQGQGAIIRNHATHQYGTPADRRVTIIKRHNKSPSISEPARPTNGLLDISQLKKGDKLVLENIYFYPSRHRILPKSYPVLQQLLETLKAHPNLRIRVEGHICCIETGTDALDLDTDQRTLSQNRARFIYQWLIDQGIAKDRLEWKGFARSQPRVFPEKSEADANKNRRVEIRILSSQ